MRLIERKLRYIHILLFKYHQALSKRVKRVQNGQKKKYNLDVLAGFVCAALVSDFNSIACLILRLKLLYSDK